MSKTKVDKEGIANAVHRAVCEFTGTDGCGHCPLYCGAGAAVLTYLTGDANRYYIQAGALYVEADPENQLWIGHDPSYHDSASDAFRAGEFHCWLASGKGAAGERVPACGLVDFTSRHWPRVLAESQCPDGTVVKWTRSEDVPPFIASLSSH